MMVPLPVHSYHHTLRAGLSNRLLDVSNLSLVLTSNHISSKHKKQNVSPWRHTNGASFLHLLLTYKEISYPNPNLGYRCVTCNPMLVSPSPRGMNSSAPDGKPLMLSSFSRPTPEM